MHGGMSAKSNAPAVSRPATAARARQARARLPRSAGSPARARRSRAITRLRRSGSVRPRRHRSPATPPRPGPCRRNPDTPPSIPKRWPGPSGRLKECIDTNPERRGNRPRGKRGKRWLRRSRSLAGARRGAANGRSSSRRRAGGTAMGPFDWVRAAACPRPSTAEGSAATMERTGASCHRSENGTKRGAPHRPRRSVRVAAGTIRFADRRRAGRAHG